MGRKKYQIDIALKFWWLTRLAKRLGHLPVFRRMAGLVASDKAFRGSFIPVGEEIEVPPGTAAPREIIEDYIRRASHRTIIGFCPCRVGQGCQRHPSDLGCLLIGEGAREVHPQVGRPANTDEALAHLDRALESGLLPLIGHIKIDQVVYGVKDYGRLLTICFCCDCCCVLRSGMRGLVASYPDSLVKLEGVSVEVDSELCVGCGQCVPVCPVESLSLEGGVAVIGPMCLGCGACARACERGFIKLRISEGSSPADDIRRRIEAGVSID